MSDQVTISFVKRTLLHVINKYLFICQLTYRLIECLPADKENMKNMIHLFSKQTINWIIPAITMIILSAVLWLHFTRFD